MNHADLIKQMTLEEKASFCSGLDYWHTPGIERLGIPVVMWTDGPHGIRKRAEKMDKDARANYITSYCNDMQTKAFNDGKLILHKVISAQDGNNTAGHPIEVKLNASKYSDVPPVPEGSTGFFGFHFPL